MDFSVIFQLRTKKFWWMDVLFYFAVALLMSTMFCYIIFVVKNNMQRQDIKEETAKLQTVGTDEQKAHETYVVDYKDKINDFSNLFQAHEFASNVFAFMQAQTLPNVWFSHFDLDEQSDSVQLSGEADSVDALSRQVANFESQDNKQYIKSIGTINSMLGNSARVQFSIDLELNQNIFSYIYETALAAPAPAINQLPIALATGSQSAFAPMVPLTTQVPATGSQGAVAVSAQAQNSENLPQVLSKASQKSGQSAIIFVILIILVVVVASAVILFIWFKKNKKADTSHAN